MKGGKIPNAGRKKKEHTRTLSAIYMKKRVKPEGSGRKKGSGVKYKRTFSIDVELKDFKVKSKVVNQLLWNEYLKQKTN